jgi:large subunit ribosomal protein L6
MSRLAKKTISIEQGVTIIQDVNTLTFRGPKGEKRLSILPYVNILIKDGALSVTSDKNMKQAKANTGTMWSLIRNAQEGVNHGFRKILEIEGIGYRANLEGKTLVLSLGYVNPVRVEPPEGILISVEKNQVTITGFDKELVGQVAAHIRALKKPEPYKGKGIHYQGEIIRRKAGKKATTTAT